MLPGDPAVRRVEPSRTRRTAPDPLRVRPALDVTGTFKQRKIELVKEGCDPTIVSDPIYFDDPREGREAVGLLLYTVLGPAWEARRRAAEAVRADEPQVGAGDHGSHAGRLPRM